MKTTHTPGPWLIGQIQPQHNSQVDAWQVAIVQKDDTPDQIIPAFAFGKTRIQCIANAFLIAAAPDLLEELEKAHNFIKVFITNVPHGDWHCAMTAGLKSMSEAINKAKGL